MGTAKELIEILEKVYNKMTFVNNDNVLIYVAGAYSMEISNDILAVFFTDGEGVKQQKVSITDDRVKVIYNNILYDLAAGEEAEFITTVINFLNTL